MTKLLAKLSKQIFKNEIPNLEQKLLTKINKIQKELNKEQNQTIKDKLLVQLNKYNKELQEIYENNPAKLKFRLEEMTKKLNKEIKKNKEDKAFNDYLKYILEKNLNNIIINKNSEELKSLIKYENIDFDMIYENITPKPYSYENNYLQAIENWYSLLEDNFIILTQKSFNYLLGSEEILKLKTGNQLDICILTCAIMHKLGDFNAKVCVAEMSDFSTNYFVKTKYKYKTLIFDFYNSEKFDDYLELDNKIFEKYKPEGKEIREIKFCFNAFDYDEQ